jgi:uncharacterized membrane protein
MDGLSVFTAFGLSTSAGLNAYLPLLVVALLARFTDFITLKSPWNALESWWVIGILTVLLLIEILVDKVPAVDSINDAVQTFVRPAAGAVLFAASAGVISDAHPVACCQGYGPAGHHGYYRGSGQPGGQHRRGCALPHTGRVGRDGADTGRPPFGFGVGLVCPLEAPPQAGNACLVVSPGAFI